MSKLVNESGFVTIHNIIHEVETVFPKALQLIGDPARTGAVLTFYAIGQEAPIEFRCVVGQLTEEKQLKYWAFSMEKVLRLLTHPEHYSSYESRNEIGLRFGGAICADFYIISLSGLPEQWDEAVALVLACRTLTLPVKRAELIAKSNGNPYFKKLLDGLSDAAL